jgi:hypothetical protein
MVENSPFMMQMNHIILRGDCSVKYAPALAGIYQRNAVSPTKIAASAR